MDTLIIKSVCLVFVIFAIAYLILIIDKQAGEDIKSLENIINNLLVALVTHLVPKPKKPEQP